jgi:hypothetical protein
MRNKTWREKFEEWADRCVEFKRPDREYCAYQAGIRHERARKKEEERKFAEPIFEALQKAEPQWVKPLVKVRPCKLTEAWKKSAKEWRAWAKSYKIRIDQTEKGWGLLLEMKNARIGNLKKDVEILEGQNKRLAFEIKRLEAQNRPWYVKLWGAMWGR